MLGAPEVVSLVIAGTGLVSAAAAGAVKMVLNGSAQRIKDVLESVGKLEDTLKGHVETTRADFDTIRDKVADVSERLASIEGNRWKRRADDT